MIQRIDAFLLSQISFPIKNIKYGLTADSFEKIFFYEISDVDVQTEKIINSFLRVGKEVLLSRISTIENKKTFENVIILLSEIISKSKQEISKNFHIEYDTIVSIQKNEFCKLLLFLWNVLKKFEKNHSLSVLSLSGNPKVFFKNEPDIKNWIKSNIDDETHHGWIIFDQICFNDQDSWKGYLVAGGCRETIKIKISDPVFLEKLISCKMNESNGLLNGDTYLCAFRIETDLWGEKRTYNIVTVEDQFRADQITHQEQFGF